MDITTRPPRLQLFALLLCGLALGACIPGFAPTPTPMPSLELIQRTPAAPCVAVLLPGMLDSAETFRRQGFAEEAATKAPGLDLVAADAHFGYYRKNMILTRLNEDLVGPLQAEGTRVWLVGTSLGGIGSLLYARGQNGEQRVPGAEELEGIVLLAPFLGEDELIEEIEAAGGPLSWSPPSAARGEAGSRAAVGEAAWIWMLDWYRSGDPKPRIVLGWGEKDDLAPAATLAAELLPARDVFKRPGGHDWDVWRALWSDMLDAGVFAGCSAG
ncbi:MAG: hypothetical protein AAGM22_12070 [Acidobacteriota bacterium]